MKKKKYIFLFLILTIGCLLAFLLIMPKIGRPSRSTISRMRTENLDDWRQATLFYINNNNDFPNGLYDVFHYNYRKKSGINPEFLTWFIHKKEHSLIYDDNILEDSRAFNEKIDFELIRENDTWFIQEKKCYPPLFNDLWIMDREGNISHREN